MSDMKTAASGIILVISPMALVGACGDTGATCEEPSLVRRVANGAFDEAGTSVLLAENRYETCYPTWPYYAAPEGRNFEVVRYDVPAAELAALGGSPSRAAYLELVDSAREIVRIPDEGQNGSIQYDAVYYFRDGTRVLGGMDREVLLLDTTSGEVRVLRAPAERLSELLGQSGLSDSLSVEQATPAPDGETVAVFQTLYGGRGYRHVISFFDAETGAHRGSHEVSVDGKIPTELALKLKPALDEVYYPIRFLWRTDSQGVYVVTRDRSIVIDLQGVSSTADMVPEEPVPTRGGRVADDGRLLRFFLEDSNDTRLVVANAPGWIPFLEIPTIPAGTQDYSF